MDVLIAQISPVSGALTLPVDKAICHRAALISALAPGMVEMSPWPAGDDCRHTLEALRALGISLRLSPEGLQIGGVGLTGLQAPRHEVFCGNRDTRTFANSIR